jgi:hypothetical protein
MSARVTPPGRLPASVPSEAYLRAADREELEREQAELYVVAAAIDELGPESGYGPQAVYWLRGPWAGAERVLSLAVNGYRRRQVAGLRDALRRSDRVGPFRLARRRTESGRSAWSLIPGDAGGEQLSLEEGAPHEA